jgi:hypothetical protein
MKVTKIVVHHSASDRKTTTKKDIEKWHKDRGFSQIGYHKIIEGTGMIKKGRSELIQGAQGTKGDGVEFRRFFFHLFVAMKSHATSSQNRCPPASPELVGALHHIICRGIERRNIFKGRNAFVPSVLDGLV